MADIHSTAVVSPGAELHAECHVGPYSVIGAHVRVGRGTKIGSHVVLEGHTSIGEDNIIFQFASVGAVPQDLKYRGEPSELIIGNRNIVREFVTLQPGTEGGGMKTVIGDGNLFMACSHVGHDGIIGDRCVFANSSALAGHVVVGNGVTVGGMAGIHQFVRLCDLSIIAAGAMVAEDVPPFSMVHGDRARLVGLNMVGLKRAGLTESEISSLRKLYRTVFLSHGRLSERLAIGREKMGQSGPEKVLMDFLEASTQRGIVPLRQKITTAQDAAKDND